MKNQAGLAPAVIILIVAGLILVALVLNGTRGLNLSTGKNPSPSPKVTVETDKQSLYEQNKEKIKADLSLSEKEFQVLKRFSAD